MMIYLIMKYSPPGIQHHKVDRVFTNLALAKEYLDYQGDEYGHRKKWSKIYEGDWHMESFEAT